MKKNFKRHGFTLVELLIVIVVIGVLSAMMMLSSTEAVSSAKASNIISNMRNLKTAVLSWYTDNLDRVVKTNDKNKYKILNKDNPSEKKELFDFIKSGGNQEILAYMSNGSSIMLCDKSGAGVEPKPKSGFYILRADNGNNNNKNDWYIGYRIDDNGNNKDMTLRKKIESRATSLGLVGWTTKTTYDSTENDVYMLIQRLE